MFTLCRDGRELPDGRPESSQERRDHRPSGCGQMVAVRAGDLADHDDTTLDDLLRRQYPDRRFP